MTSGANGECVRQGTPRDDNADWNEEQSEYGTALSPAEWDDYSSEQSVPVAAPRAQVTEGAPTAASPGTPGERDHEPVPGQEPDSDEEYRSDETDEGTEADPVGDADDSGMEPVRVDPVRTDDSAQPGSTAFDPDADVPMATDVYVEDQGEETMRPRPFVPDASMTAVGTTEPTFADDTPDLPDHLDSDDFDTHDVDSHDDEYSAAPEAPMTDPDRDEAFHADTVEADEDGPMEAAEYLAVDPVPVDVFEDDAPASAASPDSPAHDLAVDSDDDAYTPDDDDAYTPDDDDAHTPDVAEEDANEMANDNTDDEQDRYVDDEMEATQAVPVTVVAADPAPTGTVPDGLYRGAGAEPTAVIAEETYPDVDVEEERLQARLDAERTAREQRLGAVATSSENASRDDAGPARVTTDKFFPSFSLFVLRLVTASILGLTSWQILGSGVDSTATYLGNFPLIPEPRLVAWILGFTLGALALLLVIGLLQRVAGFVLLALAVLSLTFIRWGSTIRIFDADTAGFLGDKDLLLAAVGLVLLGLGGGRGGIDGAFRASRAASKAEREG